MRAVAVAMVVGCGPWGASGGSRPVCGGGRGSTVGRWPVDSGAGRWLMAGSVGREPWPVAAVGGWWPMCGQLPGRQTVGGGDRWLPCGRWPRPVVDARGWSSGIGSRPTVVDRWPVACGRGRRPMVDRWSASGAAAGRWRGSVVASWLMAAVPDWRPVARGLWARAMTEWVVGGRERRSVGGGDRWSLRGSWPRPVTGGPGPVDAVGGCRVRMVSGGPWRRGP